MAVAFASAGAVAFSAANGTSVAPAYPTSITAGDLLILYVGMKPSTANGGTVTTPSGWTLIKSLVGAGGYATTLAADTGNTNIWAFYKVAAAETGSLTVTVGTNSVAWAQIKRYTNTSTVWSVVGDTGSDTAAGNWSITAASTLAIRAGDFVDFAATLPTDVNGTANMSAHALSATGISAFSAITEDADTSSGNGNDIGVVTAHASVTTGAATAPVTWTATAGATTTNVRGPGIILGIHEVVDVTSGSLTLKETVNPGAAYNSVNSTATVASGSFSPPANALIVVLWAGNDVGTATATTAPTITDSLATHLTWTRQTWKSDATSPTANAQAAVFTATTSTAPGAMTVTVTNNTTGATSRQAAVEPLVFTDSSGLAPTAGVTGSSALTTTANVSQSVTPTATGSWLLLGTSALVTGTHAAGTGMTLLATGGSTGFSYGFFRRTVADGVSGSAMTLAATVGGTDKAWAYLGVSPAVLPKVNTLTDDFTTLNAAKWTNNGGASVSIVSGALQIATTNAYPNVTSVNKYDLRDSILTVEVPQIPNVGTGTTSARMDAYVDSSSRVSIYWQAGSLTASYTSGGVENAVNVGYNATAHKIWRIRESGGTLYWEASSTGVAWSSLRPSVATPVNVSAISVVFNSGYYGTEATPGAAQYDNVNATYADPPPAPRTFYVDPVGSDANDGLSSGAPWATVAKVTGTLLYPGDVVQFKRGGSWTGNLVISGSGTAASPITVTGYGTGAAPIISGGGAAGTLGTQKPCEVYGSFVILDGVEFRGSSAEDVYVNGTDCTVQNCTIRWGPYGVRQTAQAARLTITLNTIVDVNTAVIGPGTNDDTGGQAILLEGDAAEVSYNTISGSVFTSPDYGLDGSCIEVWGATNASIHHNYGLGSACFAELGSTATSNCIFYDNVFLSNVAGADGFVVHGALYDDAVTPDPFGPVTGTKIYHNTTVLTAGDSGTIGAWMSPNGEVDLQNNIFVVTGAGTMTAIATTNRTVTESGNVFWGGAGNANLTLPGGINAASTIADPLFVSPTDLRLQPGSPALDRGSDLGYAIDYAGNPRNSGLAPDAGAYEGVVYAYAVTDPAGVIDDQTRVTSTVVTVTDPAGLIGAQSLGHGLALSDAAGLTGTQTLTLTYQVDDPAGLTDTPVTALSMVVADLTGPADASALTVARAITDTTGALDDPALTVSRAATDMAGAGDAAASAAAVVLTVADLAALADSPSLAVGQTVTDAAGTADSSARTVAPPIGNLFDDFTTADSSRWNGYAGANVAVVGGQLQVTPAAGYFNASSVDVYSLWGGSATVQAVQTPNVGNGSTEMSLQLDADANNGVRMLWGADVLSAQERIGGGAWQGSTVAYDPAAMSWWRIRHDGTTCYWEYSGDRVTWTVMRSSPTSVNVAAVTVYLAAGYWGTETSPGLAIFDNLDVVAPVLTDNAGTTDNAAPNLTVGGSGYAYTVNDQAGSVDAEAVAVGYGVTDAAGTVDSQVLDAGRGVSDPVGLVDAAAASADWGRAVDDRAGAVDAQLLAVARQVDDQAAGADSTGVTAAWVRAVTDDAGVTDAVAAAKSGSATLTVDDPAGLVDGQALNLARGVTDPIGSADALALGASRAVTETAGAVDALALAVARQVDDLAGQGDATTLAAAWARVVDDATGTVDLAVPAKSGSAAVTVGDSSGLADATGLSVGRVVDDAAGLIDVAAAASVYARSVTDPAGSTDAAAQVSATFRAIIDGVGLTDDELVFFLADVIPVRVTNSSSAVTAIRSSTAVLVPVYSSDDDVL